MNKSAAIRSFAMTNMLLEAELDELEEKFDIDLGRSEPSPKEVEGKYYPQFDASLRVEAKKMAAHYEIFYCLEKTIRQLILDIFETTGDPNWWENLIPEEIRKNVVRSIKREKEAAVTPRSSSNIDYTTFGELAEIIKSNWGLFGGSVFNDIKAVQKVMGSLNSLRNPIAHCSPLAEDEVLRLDLSLRDWFRLMD